MRIKNRLLLLILFFFLTAVFESSAQSKIEIKNAQSLEYDEHSGIPARRLIGNVILAQRDVTLYCDSAWLYQETNKAECFGAVRITQGDKFQATAGYMQYDGNTNLAFLEKNVVLQDGDTRMETDKVDYNTESKTGFYLNYARITRPDGTLRSKRGIYRSENKTFYFKQEVEIENQEMRLKGDSLHYRTDTKRTDMFGPTWIATPTAQMYSERGWYNAKSKEMFLYKKARVLLEKKQFISGDTLFYQQEIGKGYAHCIVHYFDSVERVALWSDYVRFNKKTGEILSYENPMLVRLSEDDTALLISDTLFRKKTIKDSLRIMKAWHRVRGGQKDLMFSCDSVYYSEKDSVFNLYTEPILWSESFQITGRFMQLYMHENVINRLKITDDSFIIKEEDSLRYSQIKGKNTLALLKDKKMDRVYVNGNGESMYWIRNEKEKILGVNKIECSDMEIGMKEGKPQDLHFYNKPTAKLTPSKLARGTDFRLKDFRWLKTEKDTLKKVLAPLKELISRKKEAPFFLEWKTTP